MLQKLKRNKKGFTLAELLIVVAIIAILVAIAIPTFNNAMTKAQAGVEKANARATHAECMVDYLFDETETGSKTYSGVTYTWSYNNGQPTVVVGSTTYGFDIGNGLAAGAADPAA